MSKTDSQEPVNLVLPMEEVHAVSSAEEAIEVFEYEYENSSKLVELDEAETVLPAEEVFKYEYVKGFELNEDDRLIRLWVFLSMTLKNIREKRDEDCCKWYADAIKEKHLPWISDEIEKIEKKLSRDELTELLDKFQSYVNEEFERMKKWYPDDYKIYENDLKAHLQWLSNKLDN